MWIHIVLCKWLTLKEVIVRSLPRMAILNIYMYFVFYDFRRIVALLNFVLVFQKLNVFIDIQQYNMPRLMFARMLLPLSGMFLTYPLVVSLHWKGGNCEWLYSNSFLTQLHVVATIFVKDRCFSVHVHFSTLLCSFSLEIVKYTQYTCRS